MVGLLCTASSLSTRSLTASAVVEAGSKPYSKDIVQITLLYSKGGRNVKLSSQNCSMMFSKQVYLPL